MTSVGEVGSPAMQEKLRPHLGLRGHGHLPSQEGPGARPGGPRTDSADLRPGDLVSRLLAATPPYLYSLPHPTSFFFSEMLRSLVAAKAGEAPAPQTRRPRKRTWRDSMKPPPGPAAPPPDKPLELTTPRAEDKQPPPVPPPPLSPTVLPPPPMGMPPCGMLPPLPSPDSALPPDLLLPPSQPPLWYPPLYPLPPHQPPYPIDPLHFFIDLRVSGHIFDRKSKEGESGGDDGKAAAVEMSPASSLVRQTKHCSAFSVPQPRSKQQASPPPQSPSDNLGPNYVLQNLSRIYDDVRPFGQRRGHHRSANTNKMAEEEEANNNSISIDESKAAVVEEKLEREEHYGNKEKAANDGGDSDSKEETEEEKKKKKDIRALLGLELVVDYVNQDDVPGKRRRPSCQEDKPMSDEEEDDDEVIPAKEEDSDSSPDDEGKMSPSRPRSPIPFQPHPGLGGGHISHHFHHGVRLPPPHFGSPLFLREAADALNLQVRQ